MKLNAKNFLNFGMIINSLGTDVMKIVFVGFTGHQVVISPILLIIYTILIGIYIKWVTLIGFAVIILATIL